MCELQAVNQRKDNTTEPMQKLITTLCSETKNWIEQNLSTNDDYNVPYKTFRSSEIKDYHHSYAPLN